MILDEEERTGVNNTFIEYILQVLINVTCICWFRENTEWLYFII